MIETLLSPFQFEFMRSAFLIALIVSVPTALLSCFLVLKGWALMGDAVSHAVLPGIVLAYILGLPLILGAFGAGMLTAVATGFLTENSRVKQDTVMGVVFSGGLGINKDTWTKLPPEVQKAMKEAEEKNIDFNTPGVWEQVYEQVMEGAR